MHILVDSSVGNSRDVEYTTDSPTVNDDYSILCDELLEEFKADLIQGNASQNKVKSNTKPNDQNIACTNHKQIFHVNNVKSVVGNISNTEYNINILDTGDKSVYSDHHINIHEDHNNLLAIIEEAAHSLQSL